MDTTTTAPAADTHDEAVLAKINTYRKNPPQNSRVFTFTPYICEQVLGVNVGNRPKKPAKIAQYAADMQAGLWAITGDTIKFSDTGVLRDGQNRMMACVRSGVPFTSHVVFGIPHDSFDVMDRGRNRDPSDILAIAGYADTVPLAAGIRWVDALMTGTVPARATLEPKTVLDLLVNKYPDFPPFLTYGNKANSQKGMVAAHIYAFAQKDKAMAATFGDAWVGGNHSGKFAPLRLVDKRFLEVTQAGGRVHDVVRSALVVMAWNLFRAGHKGSYKSFTWSLGDTFPTIA